MDYTTLGRTGLRVSIAGLGGGGHSRLGLAHGHSEAHASDLVRRALDMGINILDTAEAYGTETAIGRALTGRDAADVIVCTKSSPRKDSGLVDGPALRAGVESSLARLGRERIDVFYLHGVSVGDYPHCAETLLPVLQALRNEGKIRCLGLTEAFGSDPSHLTLQRALQDDSWDVVMVGFNLLNPSARHTVLPAASRHGTGVTNMFAVRRALSRPEVLRTVIDRLVAAGHNPPAGLPAVDPLGFLMHPDGAGNLADAAYRFCRHEPGIDVVLFGTGNPDHLAANVASLLRPPLPAADLARLGQLFGLVDSESGN